MGLQEAGHAIFDFCVYQRAFFETLMTHESVLMRRNAMQERRAFVTIACLPFERIGYECKHPSLDTQGSLPTLHPHAPSFMSLLLYLTHNVREFEQRYIDKRDVMALPHLEATMLLITRLHIFALQHQGRIRRTYRALYQLSSDEQRAAFASTLTSFNTSLEHEYTQLSIHNTFQYTPSTVQDIWPTGENCIPRSLLFLLGLSQRDQDIYFEKVKRDPSFFDPHGPSRVFATLLTCDSPLTGLLKSYHHTRQERCALMAGAHGHAAPSSSSTPHITASRKKASTSTHFLESSPLKKVHVPHLPCLHLPSSMTGLNLSPRTTSEHSPRLSPGNTPRRQKEIDHIGVPQEKSKSSKSTPSAQR